MIATYVHLLPRIGADWVSKYSGHRYQVRHCSNSFPGGTCSNTNTSVKFANKMSTATLSSSMPSYIHILVNIYRRTTSQFLLIQSTHKDVKLKPLICSEGRQVSYYVYHGDKFVYQKGNPTSKCSDGPERNPGNSNWRGSVGGQLSRRKILSQHGAKKPLDAEGVANVHPFIR